MKNGTKPLMLGLLLLSVPACRSSTPPPIDIAIGDGVGGADGTLATGGHKYYAPSELKNAWIIPSEEQAQAFVSWCYDAPQPIIKSEMLRIKVASRGR